jgi:hypothetical protein
VYSFDWEPAMIAWTLEEDAGVSQCHTISTKQSLFCMALAHNKPDYIQCLPANVEVQINLWNTN